LYAFDTQASMSYVRRSLSGAGLQVTCDDRVTVVNAGLCVADGKKIFTFEADVVAVEKSHR
jgi:hypothetical protein